MEGQTPMPTSARADARLTVESYEVTKRRPFERGGVREYWLVDPRLEAVRVFERAEPH